jgi:hypothetical protein
MRMNLAMTCVYHKPLIIRVINKDLKHLFPYTLISPSPEALMDCAPFAVRCWQITPRSASPQYPEDRVDESAIIKSDAAPLALLSRQMWFEQSPCRVRNIVSVLPVVHIHTSFGKM